MPISKEKKKLYPENWDEISKQVRSEAGNKCKLCDAENKEPHPVTKSKVVLTVHHLDFNPRNNEKYNLMALCQRCHNRLDAKKRAHDRKGKTDFEKGTLNNELRRILDTYKDTEYTEIDVKRVRKALKKYYEVESITGRKIYISKRIDLTRLSKAIVSEFQKDRYVARDKALREIEELIGG